MQRNQTLVAFTDADGCVFNPYWDWLFLHIIAKYGDFFLQYGRNPESLLKSELLVKEKLAEIKREVLEIPQYTEGEPVRMVNIPAQHNVVVQVLKNYGYASLEGLNEEKIEELLASIKLNYRKFILNLGEEGKQLLDALLFAANKPFINELKDRVIRERYQNFILLSASNRQSFVYDEGNSEENGTGLFCPALVAIKERFNELLGREDYPAKCVLDMFLLADIYGDLKPGASFALILEAVAAELKREEDTDEINHSDYVFDRRKFSLLYAMMHHIAGKFSNDKITIAFFEDREDIYEALVTIFSKHCDLIPDNVVIEFWPYEGNLPRLKDVKTDDMAAMQKGAILALEGKGQIDFNYYESVLRIAALSGHDEETKPVIDAIEDMDIERFKQERVLLCQDKTPSNYQNKLTIFEQSVADTRHVAQTDTSSQTQELKQKNGVNSLV